MDMTIDILKKSYVDDVIIYLIGDEPLVVTDNTLTMNTARELFGCQCLSQTVTKANKKLERYGIPYRIKNTKPDGGYAIYKGIKIN